MGRNGKLVAIDAFAQTIVLLRNKPVDFITEEDLIKNLCEMYNVPRDEAEKVIKNAASMTLIEREVRIRLKK